MSRARHTTLTGTLLPTPVTVAPSPVAVRQRDALLKPTKYSNSPLVIAVVHRLSGWKLHTLLTPPGAPPVASFDENFVRTSIVAGFIMADGRSVVARLPQAEAEMLNLTTSFRAQKTAAPASEDELWLVRSDGMQFAARFVGLDSSTGLSLLESDQPLVKPFSETRAMRLAVGQRVRLIAPLPAESSAPAMSSAPAVSVTITTPPAISDDAPVGETGVLYMNMSEEPGQLREIKLSPYGRPAKVTVDVDRTSPESAGGVALSETGSLVGIVEESRERETHLLPAEAVRGAAARVKFKRASVLQPWLGASGDAVADTPLQVFITHGWPPAQARLLRARRRGVLLTSVAPDTPAARAGLRTGDVIARIGTHDVSSIEDMSSMIREAGGNSRARFRVLRATGAPPLDLAVQLSESPSPILDTARAELRAAQSDFQLKTDSVRLAQNETGRAESTLRQLEHESQNIKVPAHEPAAFSQLQKNLALAREQARTARERLSTAQLDLQQLRLRLDTAQARFRAASDMYAGLAVKPLLAFGLMAVAISPSGARYFGGRTGGGLVVMSVQAGSAAALVNLRAGDIIETINGQRATATNWNTNYSTDFDSDFTLGLIRDGEQLSIQLSRRSDPR